MGVWGAYGAYMHVALSSVGEESKIKPEDTGEVPDDDLQDAHFPAMAVLDKAVCGLQPA